MTYNQKIILNNQITKKPVLMARINYLRLLQLSSPLLDVSAGKRRFLERNIFYNSDKRKLYK